MKRVAVLDVGTNSVKFHLAERSPQGAWRVLSDRSVVTRLGEGLSATGGRFSEAAMHRTADAIAGMVEEAVRHQATDIVGVGTMGMRTAINSSELIDEVQRRTGVRIEVISGTEEGRIAYLAVKSGIPPVNGSLVVFDSGGGSTQFTFGAGDKVAEQFSLNIGAVRFTERFGLARAVGSEVVLEVAQALDGEFSRLDGVAPPAAVVGMGGAVTNLAAVMLRLERYDPSAVQGAQLSRTEIDRQIEGYRTRSSESRRSTVGLQPERAEVILAGACIVRAVLQKLGAVSMSVSDRGLRHGVLVDRFGA